MSSRLFSTLESEFPLSIAIACVSVGLQAIRVILSVFRSWHPNTLYAQSIPVHADGLAWSQIEPESKRSELTIGGPADSSSSAPLNSSHVVVATAIMMIGQR